jgi:hypothetical protein
MSLSPGCFDPDAFDERLNDVQRTLEDSFRVEENWLPADGASTALVSVRIPPGADAENRAVTFGTTRGYFGSGTDRQAVVTAGPDDRANVHLRSEARIGVATVSAEYLGARVEDEIEFVPALPESGKMEIDRFSVGASWTDEVGLMVALLRSSGTPTPGTEVRVAATDSLGTGVGRFRALTPSDDDGHITARFSPGPIFYRGPVRVEARFAIASGESANTSAIVEVIDP